MDVLKPDVVLYGEPVPLIEHAFDVAVSADLLLVLGSSLEVSPVNHIPLEAAHAGVMTALINYTPTRMDRVFDLTIQAGIGDTCQQLRSLLEAHPHGQTVLAGNLSALILFLSVFYQQLK
jgi:NAD-dependent deacetylase